MAEEKEIVHLHLIVTDPKKAREIEARIGVITRNLYPAFTDQQHHLMLLAVLLYGSASVLSDISASAPETAQPVLRGVATQHVRMVHELGRAFMMPVPQMQAVFDRIPEVMQHAGDSIWNEATNTIN